MKLLSIAIPCYNSMDYMENCIKSLLIGGEDVEILIVNDGSKDKTAEIADAYAEKYPTIVKAIHQENGGHGEAVNAGLRNATGYFYKVVDSDDWVDPYAYRKILDFLKDAVKEPVPLDMLLSNYVYEKQGAKRKKIIHYHHVLPENEYFGWNDIHHFKASQNILMHSVIYRTQVLRDCGFELPKHTFYVDNIFVYWPLPYVHKMYYLDVDFYRYFIGRDDQSVNEKVMMSRIDQQIRVNKILIDIYAKHEAGLIYKPLRNYMIHYLRTIQMVTSVLLMKIDTEEAELKKNDIWTYLKRKSRKGYRLVRLHPFGFLVSRQGRAIHYATMGAYKIAQKIFGFN